MQSASHSDYYKRQLTLRLYISIAVLVTCVKILLIPAYRSTDFEVHRNWLAVTLSLPLNQWYVDETSQWTLDYPPLFAWMERLLACFAQWCDAKMLIVENLNYASHATIIFQRLSVIITDSMLTYSIWGWICYYAKCKNQSKDDQSQLNVLNPLTALAVLFLANFGILIVDNIHFQYNGFLFGILLLSMLRIAETRFIEGAFWFAVLLNLKHIYLYIAPAYGVYLLRAYCFDSGQRGRLILSSFRLTRFLCLGFTVITVFGLSFGPFIYAGQVSQVLSRLFPFKRGLCHAYWAPNFWALYNITDKVLSVLLKMMGLVSPSSNSTASMTGGLVQEYEHSVLPSVLPVAAMLLTSLSIVPALYAVWSQPFHTGEKATASFVRSVMLCAYGAFFFGWHVHEKAILLITVPLAILATRSKQDGRLFALLSTVGYYSLMPLVFTGAESTVKYGLLVLHVIFTLYALGKIFKDFDETPVRRSWHRLPMLDELETLYVGGLIVIEGYAAVIHPMFGLNQSLPFLPLLITSVYSAIGVGCVWVKAYYGLFTN